jgi:hypothetical protein
MKDIDLGATSAWEFSIYVSDDAGPVDMTGKTVCVVFTDLQNNEVGRVTTGAGITITANAPGAGVPNDRLDIYVARDAHADLEVATGYAVIQAQVGVLDDTTSQWRWGGEFTFKAHAGREWETV